MPEKIKVAPIDPSLETSPLVDPDATQGTLIMDSTSTQCIWNDQAFDDGDHIECEGQSYEC